MPNLNYAIANRIESPDKKYTSSNKEKFRYKDDSKDQLSWDI